MTTVSRKKPKTTPIRHARAPRRGIKRSLVGIVLLLAIAGFAVFLAPALPFISRFAALPISPSAPVTVLIAGVSHEYAGYHLRAKEDFTGLTDTMIVAQLNPEQKALKLLNVPRDTKFSPGFTSRDKINAVLPSSGPDAMVNAVSRLLDVPIDGYLLVSLDGARELVDALGGIDLNVPIRMKYTDTAAKLFIDLQPGQQHLSGTQLEGFLRFRHDNLGDIGRVKRQQDFYRALLEKLREPATLLKIPAIVSVIERNTRTNLTRDQAGATLGFLASRPRTDTLMLPGNFGLLYGVSYWVPNPTEIRGMVSQQLQSKARAAVRDAHKLSVAVLNTTRIKGLARAAREKLQAQGFKNVWISNVTTGNPEKTVIQGSSLPEALVVREALGLGEASISSNGVSGADLTVRVGADFRP
jgi:polyisoprenyl-teichoic acid--peptidoglycan teichoic acid transferase